MILLLFLCHGSLIHHLHARNTSKVLEDRMDQQGTRSLEYQVLGLVVPSTALLLHFYILDPRLVMFHRLKYRPHCMSLEIGTPAALVAVNIACTFGSQDSDRDSGLPARLGEWGGSPFY